MQFYETERLARFYLAFEKLCEQMNNRFSIYLGSLLLAIMVLTSARLDAQEISASNLKVLEQKEDSLKQWSANMVFAEEAADRFRSDSNFVRTLVRALRVQNSFYYPFDSLNISRLYSPDSAFRIFTWQLKKDEYIYHQKGAIQMNTPDGSLKLIPLYDRSMFMKDPLKTVSADTNWVGAIYYKIVLKEFNGRKYYTMLGFDDYSIASNKKWMDVMYFNDQGKPVFGGRYFNFKNDTVKRPDQYRFGIEYKKEAKTFFNYDAEKDMIIFDHLVSESDEPERKQTYIPVGEFEAFQWQNGQWVHLPNVDFDFRLKDGDFPPEATLYDASGKVNEQALEEASRRTMEKEKAAKEKEKEKPPVKKKGDN
jgi:hypothetical protein